MSKKITHEYIRNHFKNNFNANDVRYEDLRIITEYVSQQEKQEKLLELYKELATLYRDRFEYTNSATEIERLWGKIKEIENEKR